MGRSHVMVHAEQVSPSHLCVARCRTYPDISGQNRTYPDSQTSWGKKGSSRAVSSVAGSRAVSSVAGSRAVRLVACRIACRRIASHQVRRVPYRPSPDTAERMVVMRYRPSPGTATGMVSHVPYGLSPDRVPSRPSPDQCRHVPARVGDLGVSAVPTVGRTERPSPAMPRPNSAL